MSDEKTFEPKLLGFLCNWCTYAAADLAGTSRMNYPANLKVVRVPCSGRVDPLFIWKALQNGADGVLVSGCHPGDCHYGQGNYYAKRKLALTRQLLEFVGVEPERLHFDWISAAEGRKFSTVAREFTEQVKALGDTSPLKRKKVTD